MTNRHLFAQCSVRGATERVSEYILADEALYVARVARHVLFPGLVGGPADPIFRENAEIPINLFVLLLFIVVVLAEYSCSLVSLLDILEHRRVLALVRQDLSLYLACGGSEPVHLGGHVTRVPRHVVLLK